MYAFTAFFGALGKLNLLIFLVLNDFVFFLSIFDDLSLDFTFTITSFCLIDVLSRVREWRTFVERAGFSTVTTGAVDLYVSGIWNPDFLTAAVGVKILCLYVVRRLYRIIF